MKVIFIVALVAILSALAAAGVAMLRSNRADEPKSRRMMQALALRVGLSVLLFVVILFSYGMGWIRPTGVPLAG
jgi:predicted small integral membrane protein